MSLNSVSGELLFCISDTIFLWLFLLFDDLSLCFLTWCSLTPSLIKNFCSLLLSDGSVGKKCQETQVLSLDQEDPLEKKIATAFQYSFRDDPMDRWAWWAAVYGVTQSWTRLKWLSSSSSTLLLSNVNCSWRDLFLSSSIQICDWGPLWLVGEKEEERADRNISGHWRNSFPAICYGISAGSTPTKYLQVKFFPLSHEHLQNLRF